MVWIVKEYCGYPEDKVLSTKKFDTEYEALQFYYQMKAGRTIYRYFGLPQEVK